jgi:hypothetical protein
LFSTVGRKAEAEGVAESTLPGAEDFEPPRLEFATDAATVITAIERIQLAVFLSGGDCKGGLASRYRISRRL